MDFYDHNIHYTREAIFLEHKPGNLEFYSGDCRGNTISNKINLSHSTMVSDSDQESDGNEFDPSDYPISKIDDNQDVNHEIDSGLVIFYQKKNLIILIIFLIRKMIKNQLLMIYMINQTMIYILKDL